MADEKVKPLAKITSAIALGTAAWGWYTKGRDFWDERTRYTAVVVEGSYIYDYVLTWLEQQVNPRSIKFQTQYSTGHQLRRYYNSGSESKITVEGHKIKVSLRSPSIKQKDNDDADIDDFGDAFSKKLVFVAHHPDAIDALERSFINILENREKRPKKAFYYALGEYSWEDFQPTRRSIDSVFLPDGAKEDLLADLDNFFACEDRFEKMGLPWHRGYLFHGPPGNGKSSLAKAIVDRYKLNMYNMPLSSVKNDQKLQQHFNQLQPRSVVLIEDVDVYRRQVDRDKSDAKDGPTVAGLLNCLDGVNTPHGLITILTTNKVDTLDPALIRPGRVDYNLHLAEPTNEQVLNMFQFIYNEPLGAEPRPFESMAVLTDIFKRNAFDAEDARMEIKNGK